MIPRGLNRAVGSLLDPVTTCRDLCRSPSPLAFPLGVLAAASLAGLATVPLQLEVLRLALDHAPTPARQALNAELAAGLTRLIIVDRLVPPPTLVLAGLLLVSAACGVLGQGDAIVPRVRAVLAAGLVPLVTLRLGELAVAWLLPVPANPVPGLAVSLPRTLASGPDLIWPAPVPTVVEALSARFNLFTLWSVGIWAAGLRELEGRPFASWHVGLPLATLACAGLITWVLEGPVVTLILHGP